MKTSGLRITICTLILSLLMLSGVWGQVTPNVPTIAIDPYISQAEYTGGVQVTVTFPSDPGAGDVRLYANGNPLTFTLVIPAQLTYVFTIDNSVYNNPPDGTYSITARHWDGLLESPDSPALTIYIDRTAPTISTLTIASDRGSGSIAADGDVITIALTSNEAIYTLDITSVGTETPADLTTLTATATYTATALPGGDIAFTGTFSDRAGNEVTFNNTNITDASYVCYARTMTWTGVSADWSNSGNWSWAGNASSEPPSEVDDCNIVSAGTPPVLGVGATVNSLTVTSGTLTLNAGLTVSWTLDNQSVIEITNGGSINKSDSGSGTFRYSTGGGTIPVLTDYNDLEVSASTWNAGGNLSVGGNLTINGNLNSGANTITVTGDTSGAGTWTAGTGTVTVGGDFEATAFSQAGGTLILNGTTVAFAPGGPLGSLQLNAGANVTLSADLTVTTNITNGGILDIVGNALVSPTIGGAGTVRITTSGSIDAAGTIATLTVSAATDTITLDGNGGLTITNPVQGNLTTSGAVTLNSTAGTPITSLTNSGTITLNGDLHVTGNISTSVSLTVPNTRTIVQGAGADFTVSAGTVSIGTNTCTIGNLSVTGGSFTQTGPNTGTQSATSLTTGGTGTISWDSGTNGGTLALAGDITPLGGTISLGLKNLTFTANADIPAGTYNAVTVAGGATVTGQGVFFDLIVLGGGTFAEDGNVRIQRHLTINDGGSYTEDPTYTLTFGGAGSVPGGTITDSNTVTKQDLGEVIIDAGGQIKNAGGGGILMTSLAVDAGTFTAGDNTIAITGNLSGVDTFIGGAAAIDIDGDVTVANFTAASGVNSTAVGGNFTPGAFTANGGTMIFDTAGATIAAGGFTYNNVSISANKTAEAGGTLNIDGTLTTAGGATLDLDTNDTTLDVDGNTINNGTITGGTGTLTFNGTVTNNVSGVITGGNALITFGDALADTVTNDGTITAGPVADGSNAIIFTGNYAGGGGILSGSVTTNPVIRFRGEATTVGTFTHTNDPVVFDGAGDQSFAPGGSTYAAVTVNKATGTFTVNTNALECDSLTLTASAGCTFNTDLIVNGTLTNTAGGFDVNLYGTTTQMPGAIFGTTGTVRLGDGGDTLTFTGGFTHNNAGATVLNGTLRTTNTNVAIAALALGGTSEINTNTGAGNIAISGAVTNTAAQALTLNAGAGNVTLSNPVGAGVALGTLILDADGTITASSTIAAASVVITGGAVDLNDDVTAPGGFSSTGANFNNTGAPVTTTNNNITINHTGTVTIGEELSSGSGTIAIDADGLTTITAAGDITTTTGSVAFGATRTGAVETAGDITTTGGGITFTRATTIADAVTLSTGAIVGGNIAFGNTVNGVAGNSDTLTLTAGTGSVRFFNTVGAGESLGSLTVNSAAGGITADNTIEALTVSLTGGAVDLDGAVTADNGFSSEGTTFDNNETITTTDTDITINHTGAIIIGAALSSGTGAIDIDSTGSTIDINATVTTSTGAITVDADGLTTVSASVRATGAGTIEFGNTGTGGLTLSVEDPAYVAQTAGGTITFNRPVTLTENTLIWTGAGIGNITFATTAPISGTHELTLTAETGNVDLGSTAGNPAELTSLTVSSATLARFRDNITTNGLSGIDITATTINLDGLTMTAGTNAAALIRLNGNVTLTGGPANLYAIDDITVTGTVSGGEDLTVGPPTPATPDISFNGDVGTPTPLGAITISNGYDITFSGTVNALSLAQDNGSGTTTFEENVTTTGANGIDITATDIALDGLTMEATTADIALEGTVTLSTGDVELNAQDTITVTGTVDGGQNFTATSTNAIVFNDPIGETDALASLTITGGNITLNGIGTAGTAGVTGAISVTSAGNVVLNGTSYRSGNTITVTANGFVELNAADYHSTGVQTWTATTGGVRYLATANGTWSAGGTGIGCPNTDVYLDHNTRTLTLASDLSCRNLYFYRGNLDCNSVGIETDEDLVIFGTYYNPDDADWNGADTRHAYFGAAALAYYPDGGGYDNADGTFDTIPNAAFAAGGLAGTTLTVLGNFYVNGTNMTAGALTLNIPDNSESSPVLNIGNAVTANQWGTPYAVAFNMLVTGVTTNGGWVAASMPNAPETNNGVNILSTTAGGSGGWQFARPEIQLAQTVYDDVIYIELDMIAENSNGEIAAALAMPAVDINAGALWTGTGTLKIGGVYSQPDCSAPLTGDASSFYVRTDSGANPRTWNTDATGTGPGHTDSTDRDGNPQTSIPDLTGLKGLFRAANGKTMSRHYGTQNSTDFPVYDDTEDRCRPVLVEARFGQELHDGDPATQLPYDAHNFIEFRWSEPVDIGDPVNGFAGGTEETVYGIKYKKASAAFADITNFGGAITGSGPLTVSGYATFQTGRVQTGSRGTYAAPAPAEVDATVHALYREFPLVPAAAPANQPHRLRISIAGWSEETRIAYGTDWKWFWQGYIDDAQSPSGPVTVPATEFIRDRSPARNSIEGTNSVAAGYGTSNYAKDPVAVTATETGLHGTWDTTAPDFAGLKASSDDWATEPTEYELIPVSSAAGLVNRLEMHFFDNAPAYSVADGWRWRSRAGWYDSDPNTIIHAAPESFGGSRPNTGAEPLPTGGGVRDSSLFNAIYGFTLRNDAETASAGSGLTGFVTNVNSVFFNLSAPLYHLDDPYAALTIDEGIRPWPIASAELEIAYTAYAPASPSGAFVTDLAGNRMKSTPGFLRCLDRTPPKVTISLAGVNRTDLLLLFSKNITGGTGAADGIRLDLANADGSITTITPTGISEREEAEQVLIFSLPQAVTASQLVNPLSTIRFITYGNVPNPDTGEPEPASAYSDFLGNYVSLGETHRLTDVGIGLIETLYASDGVNTDGVLGEEEGALRVFDGTGRLLDRNITVGTRIVTGESAPRPLSLYFDVAPPATALPELFNSAAAATSALWLPSVLPGFNKQGNTAARALGAEQILDENRTLRNFVIPEADTEVIPGSRVEMLYRYGDLFCARLADEADITSLAPWSFSISEMKKQRGGVTILNNVIDAHKREKAIIQVEVPTAGNLVIQVFTLDGNVVRVLERGRKGGGNYTYYWDGTNVGGRPVARGMYFVRVVGPDMDEIRKVMVIKE